MFGWINIHGLHVVPQWAVTLVLHHASALCGRHAVALCAHSGVLHTIGCVNVSSCFHGKRGDASGAPALIGPQQKAVRWVVTPL